MFERRLNNGEIMRREWLIAYSPSTGNVYCIPCKLFSKLKTAFQIGFSDWKNSSSRLRDHEFSEDHMRSLTIWSTKANASCRIDCTLVKQQEEERKYLRRDVLN